MIQSYEDILNNSTILLIEDEPQLRASFSKLLSLFVGKVITATNGKEALEVLDSNIDIIFTDIKMPKMDGIEFIKRVRKKKSDIPIVITSAYSNQEYLLEAIKLSLVEYLLKPVKESDLEGVLVSCAKTLNKSSSEIAIFNETLSYDYENKIIKYIDSIINLTNKEVIFIELLLKHRGKLVTKTEIEDNLYIYKEAPPSALKNLVFKLRKKLPLNIIESNNKLGYSINSISK